MAAVIPFLKLQAIPQDALRDLRLRAWELFEKRGLPTKEDEAFRYFPVRALQDAPFEPANTSAIASIDEHVLPECKENCLVFVDGSLNLSLSRSSIAVHTLHDAMRTYGHFLRTRLSRAIEAEDDPFALLNLALHPSGAFLYLPPKAILGPLQLLFISTGRGLSLPRLQLFAGAHAKAEIVVTNVSAETSLCIPAFDFALEEGAHVRMQQIADAEGGSWHLSSLRATLKKAANFSSLQWMRGKGISRADARVLLQGAEANADLKGLWMLQEKAHAHAHVRVEHQAPHTQSMQLFKGVLSDLSQSSFEGKIYVHSEAQKTQAYQLNKNLLLSPHTIANAKPNLEIFADDVKASHGATVAHLDDELLFYLKARGLASSQAKRLLVEGFCREVLDGFSLPTLASQVMHALRNYLS